MTGKQAAAGNRPVLTAAAGADPDRELLNPFPRLRWKTVAVALPLIALYVWSFLGAKASPRDLIEGIPHILHFLGRLFPPEFDIAYLALSVPEIDVPWLPFAIPSSGAGGLRLPYPEILTAIVETVQMAVAGTTLGVLFSLPLALLAARNTSPGAWMYHATRMLLNANRAVPDIVFAILFVAAVGLGPFGGVLALAAGSMGSMGKLFAEAVESIDPKQVQAVRAAGAGRLMTFRYAVAPQALPAIASYSLLYFESNVRSAAILGIVGAGGVGFAIQNYLALFQYRKLMGAMILIILTVTLLDRLSDHLRKRFI